MKPSRLRLPALLLSTFLLAGGHASAAAPDAPAWSVREHYTKYEYQIPMRDGVRLFTVVYVPKDNGKAYPFLMDRTPYSVAVRDGDESHYGVDFRMTSRRPAIFSCARMCAGASCPRASGRK
jgi:hypothetical protein